MIRRLHLHGWRSFEEQSLDIGPGLTFLVAENGVGKTSLIDAAAWGVYGALSGVDAAGARRIGVTETRIEVDIELPGGLALQISRVADAHGKPRRRPPSGAEAVAPDSLLGLLAKAYGASAELLAQTTIVSNRAVADETVGAFFLREHLCRVLGVEDLQRVADELDALHDAAEATAKTFPAADLAALHDALAQADRQIVTLEEVRAALREEFKETEDQLRQALWYAEAAHRAAAAHAGFRDAVAASQAVLAAPSTPQTVDDLVALLEQSEQPPRPSTTCDATSRSSPAAWNRLPRPRRTSTPPPGTCLPSLPAPALRRGRRPRTTPPPGRSRGATRPGNGPPQ